MDFILQGLPRVICYLDDILITGSSEEEHPQNLKEVFRCLERHGLTLHRDKCHFLKDVVEYLGQVVDAEGIRKAPDKVREIVEAHPLTCRHVSNPFISCARETVPGDGQKTVILHSKQPSHCSLRPPSWHITNQMCLWSWQRMRRHTD